MHMTFLGPMGAIRDGGAPIDLQPKMTAALFTLLLDSDGGLVSSETLLEALWENPPTSKRPLITLMSKLKDRLGDRIQSEPEGYRLITRPADYIDVRCWQALLNVLEDGFAELDPHAAVLLYERALALWSHPLLAGLPATVPMDMMRSRLLNQRLNAIEKMAKIQLDLGRFTEVTDTLPPLVKAEPQREHLLGLLMQALYHAQRPREARDLYLQLCESLRDDNGAQPNSSLQRLYAQIHTADPALNTTPLPLPPADQAVRDNGGSLSTPSTARMASYLNVRSPKTGYHTALDRAHCEYLSAVAPDVAKTERQNEEFGARIAHELAARGIDQLIELGAPVINRYSIHHHARRANPHATVVYLNQDPALVNYSRTLLDGIDDTAFLEGDWRTVLDDPMVRKMIDFNRPVGWIDRHQFNLTEADPRIFLEPIARSMAPGSYLALTLVTQDGMPELVARQLGAIYADVPETLVMRTREQVQASIPDSLEILPPGVVEVAELWVETPPLDEPSTFGHYGVIATKTT
jgi:DNA-binding SARP family transcriptional activator